LLLGASHDGLRNQKKLSKAANKMAAFTFSGELYAIDGKTGFKPC
jgi:hypothetical protein